MANKMFKITVSGNTEKELLAPNTVVDSAIFADLCQREYDRQRRIQLGDKLAKAQDALNKALEKGVDKVKKAELVAKIEVAKELLDSFIKEVADRVGEEKLAQDYYLPTGDRLASAYIWSMFKTGGAFPITGFRELWVQTKCYKCNYKDSELQTEEQRKDFKSLKECGKVVLSQVFNTTSDSGAYKNATVKLLSAWVINGFADSVYGKLAQSKSGIYRQYLKEVESTRQLILGYLQFLGVSVDETIKKSEPESMETRSI